MSFLPFRYWPWFAALLLQGCLGWNAHGETAEEARRRLVDEILVPSGIQHPGVLASLLQTPRHEFVPRSERSSAYYDMALPIGWQQTISSPFIVAFMTESLEPQATDRVLEIGTGSGYQAAVLSPLVQDVYSIEIVEPLGKRAAQTLKRLGYANVHVKIGDGYQGWPEHAPFDKIIVTCSPEDVPQPLIDQLAESGIMIIPVGERYQQMLCRLVKRDGELVREALRTTLFVPMTGTAEAERRHQPDPRTLEVVNGSFEAEAEGNSPLAGWYYQRQVTRTRVPRGASSSHVAYFQNTTPGRSSHALQGFGLDGSAISAIDMAGEIRCENIRPGAHDSMRAMIMVSYFDQDRVPLGERWLGPWQGSHDWQPVHRRLPVPTATREAILRVGLFGATGELWVDDLTMDAVPR